MDFFIATEGGHNVDHSGGVGHLKPWKIMMIRQLLNAISNILYKKILKSGCSILPVLTYRNTIAAVSVAPFALYYRREMRSGLPWRWLAWTAGSTFVVALCRVTLALSGFYYGMQETTAAYASNIMNITPVITFIITVSLRGVLPSLIMEKLNLRTRTGKLKVLGTIICIGGAILSMIEYPIMNNLKGTFLLVGAGLLSALGQIIQDVTLEAIPARYWMITCMCLYGSFQTTLIGVLVNTTWDDWMLKWDIQLFTIFYSGFLNTAAAYFTISWVIPKRGLIYPSMFTSFSVFVTATIECQMGEHTSFKSFLGMMIIIGGLHVHLWAKDNEEQEEQAVH